MEQQYDTAASRNQATNAEPESPAADSAEPGEETTVQPGDQEIIRRLLLASAKAIYTKGISEQLVQIVQSTSQPEEGIARAAMLIVSQITAKAGIGAGMALQILPVVVALIAELAVAAGVIPSDPKIVASTIMLITQKLGGGQSPMQQQSPVGASQQPMQPPQAGTPPQPQGMIEQGMGG